MKIMSAKNISDAERNSSLWAWMEGFPSALNNILNSDGFHCYIKWENEWINGLNTEYSKDLQSLQSCLETCVKRYRSPVQKIEVVINPIKCVYSADYHLIGNRFVVTSGAFRIEIVIHEFLHHVVHPFITALKEAILERKRLYPQIDKTYYLSGDAAGQLNAFEEYAVRSLTKDFLLQNYPEDISLYLKNLL